MNIVIYFKYFPFYNTTTENAQYYIYYVMSSNNI